MMGRRVAHSVSDSEGTDTEGERGIETGVLNRLLHSRWSGLVALKGSAILLYLIQGRGVGITRDVVGTLVGTQGHRAERDSDTTINVRDFGSL